MIIIAVCSTIPRLLGGDTNAGMLGCLGNPFGITKGLAIGVDVLVEVSVVLVPKVPVLLLSDMLVSAVVAVESALLQLFLKLCWY
jgi:hypothetical protein